MYRLIILFCFTLPPLSWGKEILVTDSPIEEPLSALPGDSFFENEALWFMGTGAYGEGRWLIPGFEPKDLSLSYKGLPLNDITSPNGAVSSNHMLVTGNLSPKKLGLGEILNYELISTYSKSFKGALNLGNFLHRSLYLSIASRTSKWKIHYASEQQASRAQAGVESENYQNLHLEWDQKIINHSKYLWETKLSFNILDQDLDAYGATGAIDDEDAHQKEFQAFFATHFEAKITNKIKASVGQSLNLNSREYINESDALNPFGEGEMFWNGFRHYQKWELKRSGGGGELGVGFNLDFQSLQDKNNSESLWEGTPQVQFLIHDFMNTEFQSQWSYVFGLRQFNYSLSAQTHLSPEFVLMGDYQSQGRAPSLYQNSLASSELTAEKVDLVRLGAKLLFDSQNFLELKYQRRNETNPIDYVFTSGEFRTTNSDETQIKNSVLVQFQFHTQKLMRLSLLGAYNFNPQKAFEARFYLKTGLTWRMNNRLIMGFETKSLFSYRDVQKNLIPYYLEDKWSLRWKNAELQLKNLINSPSFEKGLNRQTRVHFLYHF